MYLLLVGVLTIPKTRYSKDLIVGAFSTALILSNSFAGKVANHAFNDIPVLSDSSFPPQRTNLPVRSFLTLLMRGVGSSCSLASSSTLSSHTVVMKSCIWNAVEVAMWWIMPDNVCMGSGLICVNWSNPFTVASVFFLSLIPKAFCAAWALVYLRGSSLSRSQYGTFWKALFPAHIK